MKKMLVFAGATLVILSSLGLRQARQTQQRANIPAFTADGRLVKPENYREWIWVSSGLGMSYNPPAQSAGSDPVFDNVFVTPEAYRSFLQTGTWPDKTILILEQRSSVGNSSINQQGHFQGQLRGLEAEVKDGGKWTFFAFENTETRPRYSPVSSANPLQPPASDSCHSCHSQNGAVDNTFVQFYPALLEVAQRRGTIKKSAESTPPKP